MIKINRLPENILELLAAAAQYLEAHPKEQILNGKLFAALGKMAKFRNLVLHHYDNVDAEILVGILKNDLEDFTGYRDAIVDFLKSKNHQ